MTAPGYLLVLTEEGYTTADGPMPRAEALEVFARWAAGLSPWSGSRLRVIAEAHYQPGEGPYCNTCGDNGFVDDPTGETGTANCPDCNPTVEQVEAATTEYQHWVATSELAPTADQL
jgi:hypothetical protein